MFHDCVDVQRIQSMTTDDLVDLVYWELLSDGSVRGDNQYDTKK